MSSHLTQVSKVRLHQPIYWCANLQSNITSKPLGATESRATARSRSRAFTSLSCQKDLNVSHSNSFFSSVQSICCKLLSVPRKHVCLIYALGVSPNFEITVACGLKFHRYLRTLSLEFQKARTKIEVFLFLPCWLN